MSNETLKHGGPPPTQRVERSPPKRPWSKPSVRLLDGIARTDGATTPDAAIETSTLDSSYSPS